MTATFSVLLPRSVPSAAEEALDEAAAAWGADYRPHDAGDGVARGGDLRLPVRHGLKNGVATGVVAIAGQGEGSRIELHSVDSRYNLNLPVFALVLLGGAGALLAMAWPIVPRLLPVAPLGALMAFQGWFILSRQQKREIDDFLKQVEAIAAAPPPLEEEAEAAGAGGGHGGNS